MSKLKIDLHPIYNKGAEIEGELDRAFGEAETKRIPLLEIISGKGNGALKKRVLRFLAKPNIKKRYFRIEKDSRNFGRLFVHFRHENKKGYH